MWSSISQKDNQWGGGGGVISLTTVDSRKGCWGFSFVFSVLCVCLYVRQGGGIVLIKYSGNVRLQTSFNLDTHKIKFV